MSARSAGAEHARGDAQLRGRAGVAGLVLVLGDLAGDRPSCAASVDSAARRPRRSRGSGGARRRAARGSRRRARSRRADVGDVGLHPAAHGARAARRGRRAARARPAATAGRGARSSRRSGSCGPRGRRATGTGPGTRRRRTPLDRLEPRPAIEPSPTCASTPWRSRSVAASWRRQRTRSANTSTCSSPATPAIVWAVMPRSSGRPSPPPRIAAAHEARAAERVGERGAGVHERLGVDGGVDEDADVAEHDALGAGELGQRLLVEGLPCSSVCSSRRSSSSRR